MQIGKHNLFLLTAAVCGLATLMEGEPGAAGGGNGQAAAGSEEKKKPEIIKAAAPAAINEFVDMSPQIFHFKTEKIKNEEGKEIGQGKKHPSVEIYLPVPKTERLVEILNNPEGKFAKEKELLMAAITDQVYRVARMQINELREKTADAQITPASLNYDKLDWTAIANMPKSERGAYVPSDDDIKAFLESYLEVMPTATGKPKNKIENHILLFQTGFKKQRSQKEILEMFKDALAVFVANAGEAAVEDHADVIEYFTNRLDRMLKTEEKITMDDL